MWDPRFPIENAELFEIPIQPGAQLNQNFYEEVKNYEAVSLFSMSCEVTTGAAVANRIVSFFLFSNYELLPIQRNYHILGIPANTLSQHVCYGPQYGERMEILSFGIFNKTNMFPVPNATRIQWGLMFSQPGDSLDRISATALGWKQAVRRIK